MSTATNTNTDSDANNHPESDNTTNSSNTQNNNNNNNNNSNALQTTVILTLPEEFRKDIETFSRLKAINPDIPVFERHSTNQVRVSPGKQYYYTNFGSFVCRS